MSKMHNPPAPRRSIARVFAPETSTLIEVATGLDVTGQALSAV